MNPILEHIREHLHSHGLFAEEYTADCLNVWATQFPFGGGLMGTHDLSRVYATPTGLTVHFPGPGQCRYAISGEPPGIIELVVSVYKTYLKKGGPVSDAVAELVSDAEQFVIGRRS